MQYQYLWAIGIALVFTAWPILGRFSGASGAWIGTLAVSGTLITTALCGSREMIVGPMFTTKAFAIMMAAGILNGVAVYFYSVKTADPNIQAGAFMAIATVSMAVLSPILDYFVNGSVMSVRQWFGVAVAVLAIYLIKG